jgi:hypothetical protein
MDQSQAQSRQARTLRREAMQIDRGRRVFSTAVSHSATGSSCVGAQEHMLIKHDPRIRHYLRISTRYRVLSVLRFTAVAIDNIDISVQ